MMRMAQEVAEKSPCLSRKVGAIIANDGEVLGGGCNAPITGLPPCTVCERAASRPGEDLDKCLAVHAEERAIHAAHYAHRSCLGATVYCTHLPCRICAEMITSVGIKRVIYKHDYPGSPARQIFAENHVHVMCK